MDIPHTVFNIPHTFNTSINIPHTVFNIGTTYGIPCSLGDGENYRSFALCFRSVGWSCAGLRRRGNSSRRHLPRGSVTRRSLPIGAWHTEESAQVVVQFYTLVWRASYYFDGAVLLSGCKGVGSSPPQAQVSRDWVGNIHVLLLLYLHTYLPPLSCSPSFVYLPSGRALLYSNGRRPVV